MDYSQCGRSLRRTPESRGNNPSNLIFDATELLHALGKLSEEYHLAKADQNALQNQVQIVGNDIAQDDAAGKTIKLHPVEIQAAYAPLADNGTYIIVSFFPDYERCGAPQSCYQSSFLGCTLLIKNVSQQCFACLKSNANSTIFAVNKYNDAVKALNDQIKPLDGEVSSLKREQLAAVNALASQSSKTTGDDTKKLQAAVNALFGVNA